MIEPQVFGDQRGYFMETWSTRNFEEMGLKYDFVSNPDQKQEEETEAENETQ